MNYKLLAWVIWIVTGAFLIVSWPSGGENRPWLVLGVLAGMVVAGALIYLRHKTR